MASSISPADMRVFKLFSLLSGVCDLGVQVLHMFDELPDCK